MPGKMTEEEVESFLDSKPDWMILTSIGQDGYPHTIPIGYFRDGSRIFMGCRDNTQKVVNIERNPKVSLSLEDGETMQGIRGVLLRGDAQVVRSEEERLAISLLTAKLEVCQKANGQYPQLLVRYLSNLKTLVWFPGIILKS